MAKLEVTLDKFLVRPKMHLALIEKLPSRRRWKLRKPNGLPKKAAGAGSGEGAPKEVASANEARAARWAAYKARAKAMREQRSKGTKSQKNRSSKKSKGGKKYRNAYSKRGGN